MEMVALSILALLLLPQVLESLVQISSFPPSPHSLAPLNARSNPALTPTHTYTTQSTSDHTFTVHTHNCTYAHTCIY